MQSCDDTIDVLTAIQEAKPLTVCYITDHVESVTVDTSATPGSIGINSPLKPVSHIDDFSGLHEFSQSLTEYFRTIIDISLVADQTTHAVQGLKPLPSLRMPLHVSIRKERPTIWTRMLPAFIPVALGEFGSNAIDRFDHIRGVDRVHVWRDADYGSIPTVQLDIIMLETTLGHTAEVIQTAETGREGPRDRAQRRDERLEDEECHTGDDQA